ncbi:uncharacterized protein JCM6883_000674 [Sporobolomyces salmoneus]|uniref:uncharacterized protein n=1 Tax=Sporobolomyces salmoneus TaxID=183962 RepID=UPI0031730670
MSNSPPAPISFISSQDFVFSDDEVEPAPSEPTEESSGGGRMGSTSTSSSTKGRMTGSANSRMNSKPVQMTQNGFYVPGPEKNPLRQSLQLPRATPLDFSTIRTETPRTPNPPPRPRGKPRKWGLEEAPVYHPSVADFADPMEYIEKIAPEAKQYGICKIVPPEGWRPPFAIDSETFRFKTRVQQLNSMEASARASLNFLEQLYLFHRQHGSAGMVIPSITGKPVDLWKLKREVGALGGYFTVTEKRQWTSVGKAMGYNVAQNTGVCSQLKTAYYRIIVPFEEYVKKVKLNGGPAPPDPVKVAQQDPNATPLMKDFVDNLNTNGTSTPKPSDGTESLATPVSPPRHNPVNTNVEISDRVRTASDRLNEALEIKPTVEEETTPGDACEVCKSERDPDHIVLCDDCDKGFHLNCLSPPLRQVPNTQFYCDRCLLLNGADYGFDEGDTHSLFSFRRRADAFKRKWLEKNPLPVDKGKGKEQQSSSNPQEDVWEEQIAIEDHFEREFWRLVESPYETVEIEYGADVNSSKDGAGFPNLEVHPLDPYSRDGWNLNNLPILSGSLLRYIKSDISGMTIPWIYVGMVFSTFAWHKEDHYTYSINYHHLGDTKTWYGIPGEDDEKLEAAMKRAAPELFDQQPDLLFQLVTLMSPGHLKENGCRVYAVDQRPNEFIITFPRAYHSGFNHGFNFNEAVNFALPDWIPIGLKCIERYREIKKNPVFSHDELLMTIAQHDKNPRTSRWLLPNVRAMVERELSDRETVRTLDPAPEEQAEDYDREEEEYQCEYCKTLCYLSQVVTPDGSHIACPEHASQLPVGEARIFRTRFTDAELTQLLNRVKSRSEKAGRYSEPSSVPSSTNYGGGGAVNGGGVSSGGGASGGGGAMLSSTTSNESLEQQQSTRTSTRKRKPSAALLEAAGETAAQRMRFSTSSVTPMMKSEEGSTIIEEEEGPEESIQYDEQGDISVGGGNERSPSVVNGGYSYAQPIHQQQQQQQQQQQYAEDLHVGFSPPRAREAVYQ